MFCMISDDFGVQEVWFVPSMKFVRNRQLAHHAHEGDAVGVRLWSTPPYDGGIRRGDVFLLSSPSTASRSPLD